MSKQTPSPHNDVFNHDANELLEATGVDKADLACRIRKIDMEYEAESGERGFQNMSTAAEKAMKEFTHKELAIMWCASSIDQ